ncbi:MAG: ribosome biogenesis/translation initiation ATPase RLI [Promethearchaeota archaeon]
MPRIAVINIDKCKPKDCGKPCMTFCPGVRMGEETVTFPDPAKHPIISESLCTGCGICIKKCPYGAIKIVNTPEQLEGEASHRYGANAFVLYRLPVPKIGKVTGIVGQNGAGKTTTLRILAGEIKPNLGHYDDPPSWNEIVTFYRGSELQLYFERIANNEIRVSYKPQYITDLPQVTKGVVGDLLEKTDQREVMEDLKRQLDLESVWDHELPKLSGGELQRVAIAAASAKDADAYLFDEPTSYLDIFQRTKIAKVIRALAGENKTVIVVEHDLAINDYVSDYTSVIFGEPGVYGIVSHPYGVREGINAFLNGYLVDENIRFRDRSITFPLHPPTPKTALIETPLVLEFGAMKKKLNGFKLAIGGGVIHQGEIIGVLGPNGIGKTTFVKILAGLLEIDKGEPPKVELTVSYKPQYISAEYDGTVREYLNEASGRKISTSIYKTEIIGPLGLKELLDRRVDSLSGGELQAVTIAGSLSRKTDLLLIDEPSAFLDVEQRLASAKTIKRTVERYKNAAFVVEHDVVYIDTVADHLMVFEGVPSLAGQVGPPVNMRSGMNKFLKTVGITLRRDARTGRPRVNKSGSRLDQEQKASGEYYYAPAK